MVNVDLKYFQDDNDIFHAIIYSLDKEELVWRAKWILV